MMEETDGGWSSPRTMCDGDIVVTVPEGVEAVTLPDALMSALPLHFPTSSSAKRACRNKGGPFCAMLPSGAQRRCDSTVNGGQTFRVVPRVKGSAAAARGAAAQLRLVHIDDVVAVVWKPAGQVIGAPPVLLL